MEYIEQASRTFYPFKTNSISFDIYYTFVNMLCSFKKQNIVKVTKWAKLTKVEQHIYKYCLRMPSLDLPSLFNYITSLGCTFPRSTFVEGDEQPYQGKLLSP